MNPSAVRAGTSARTLVDALLYHAAESPQAPFLNDMESGASLTYSEAAARAAAFAATLSGRRLRPGDRLAILLENRWEWAAAFLGCLTAGVVPVPLNTRWRAGEVREALEDCSPSLLLSDVRHRDLIPHERLVQTIDVDGFGWDHASPQSPRSDPDALGLITYTSGTTGSAKGVMVTHAALFQSAAYYAGLFNSSRRLTTAIMVPLFHNTGFVDGLGHAIVAGGRADLFRRFDERALAQHLASGDYTFFIGVPTMYARLAALLEGTVESGADPWLAYGGGPMPAATPALVRRRFPRARFVNCYGLSEATSITHYMPWRLAEGRWDAAGVPVPGTWDHLAEGGELLIDSPTVMAGYWNREEETAARFVNGWLRTGDLAERDSEGLLHVLGRMDEVINRGGEKIAPLEIETALCELPEVVEASVVGLPDADLGQVPAALVVLRPGRRLDLRTVRERLSDRIADYKLPVLLQSADALPRNANGKVLKGAVRARLGGRAGHL